MKKRLTIPFHPLGLMLIIGLMTASAAQASLTRNGVPKLISTAALAELMEGRQITIIDLRSDFFTYLPAHLPGAVYLHFETLRISDSGMPAELHTPQNYAAIFSRLGIRKDQPVVIYSEGNVNFLGTYLAWILDGFEHPEVYVLDGGYSRWVAEDRPIEKTYPRITPSEFPASPFNLRVASTADVKRALETGTTMLVDVRPPAQYLGEQGAQVRLGRIPGALSHPWFSDLDDTDTGRVFKSVEALADAYTQQGITPDKDIILYCNTGTEASHNYLVLCGLLGYENVRVYVPSFTGWSATEDLPVISGE